MTLSRISSCLPFSVAASLWLESRSFRGIPGAISARYIKPKTESFYQGCVRSLNLFFGQTPLEKVHLGHLREYQEARIAGAAPWFLRYRRPQDAKPRKMKDGTELPPIGKQPCRAKPKQVNQELCVLKMVLRRAGCWTEEMDEFYERFDEEDEDIPRALSVEQQQRWLDVSEIEERWWIVHWYSQLAMGTGMGTNEMRALRIGDVNLHHELVSVPPSGAKNSYRARTIPLLSAKTKWAVEQLLQRAGDLGARNPQDYLFPFRQWSSKRTPWGDRVGRHDVPEYDPTRPMTVSGIKKEWDQVRRVSGLTDFTPYHCRHTCLTRWAEGGMEMPTLMELAGHLTVRQTRHYAKISDGVKRRAMYEAERLRQQDEALRRQKIPHAPERSPAPFYVGRAAGWRR